MIDKPVALVTGASRGIGRGIAVGLGSHGHAVGVNYFRSPEAAEQVVAEIAAAGGTAVARARRCRLRPRIARSWSIGRAASSGGWTSWSTTRGSPRRGRRDLLEATEESWDLVFATNLKGPFFLAQLAARRMIEQISGRADRPRGLIINVSSISAYAASTNRADYCMAKAAMQMMTWLFADRLAEQRIQVFEVCPGVIASDMTAPVREKYDQLIAEGLTPIRRWGTPEDVAQAVVALTTDAFPFSTGDRINVDGGFHIRRL